jgi:VWFA-related protein
VLYAELHGKLDDQRITMKTILHVLILVTTVSAIYSQQPQSTKTAGSDDVVRIETNLVQFDAIVTDANGQVVSNLTAEDFELFVNGRKQPITNLSFNSRPTEVVTNSPKREVKSTAAPPVHITPKQVGNTYALIFDDYCITPEGFSRAHNLIQKFLAEKMEPTDVAAVISTRSGTGTLQQFTNDKRLLGAALSSIRWHRCGDTEEPNLGASTGRGEAAIESKNTDIEIDAYNRKKYAVTAVGTLEYVAQGLRDLPGRKAILMFSEGLPIQSPQTGRIDSDVLPTLRRVIEKANRASAVIYSIHLRGIDPLVFTAEDKGAINTAAAFDPEIGPLAAKRREFNFGLDGLQYASENTGGFTVRKTNDFEGGMNRVVQEQEGYYLIGYRPNDRSVSQGNAGIKFNTIKLVLKNHTGLNVRTRNGFTNTTSRSWNASNVSAGEQIIRGLQSPVGADGINLRLTSFFVETTTSAQIRSLLHLDARDLTFADASDGSRTATIDIVALTIGLGGNVVDQVKRSQTITIEHAKYDELIKEGLVYLLDVPVKEPGPYELRLAVLDIASKRVGSARQFIEIPNLRKGRLVITGLTISGRDIGGADPKTSEAIWLAKPSGPAVRKFPVGSTVDYGYAIYGTNSSSSKSLAVQTRIYRDTKEIFVGQAQPLILNQSGQPAGGSFELNNTVPGWYTLEISISAEKSTRPLAVQWIDFEVVN